ncbi:MAG: 50S ribosomal protein L11 methyltransferase, partial [Candidatus Omnitrophica bacterium]|nr:50S ribosomal protein L11 methyltransferase [Candidatus Omnitrophota bacterium]
LQHLGEKSAFLEFLKIFIERHERFHVEGDHEPKARAKTISWLARNRSALEIVVEVTSNAIFEVKLLRSFEQEIVALQFPDGLQAQRVLSFPVNESAVLRNVRAVEKSIIAANRLKVIEGSLNVPEREKTFETVMEENPKGSRYVRVGPWMIVARSLVLPRPMSRELSSYIFVIDQPQPSAVYLLATIAAMLSVDLKGKIVEIDGIGTGVLAQIALFLGAQRVIGIDQDHQMIDQANRNLHREHYEGEALVRNGWKAFRAQPGEQYVLMKGNLNDWYRLSEQERATIAGGPIAVRINNMGRHYPAIHQTFLRDIALHGQNVTAVIIADYVDGGDRAFLAAVGAAHLSIDRDMGRLDSIGWRPTVAVYSDQEHAGRLFVAIFSDERVPQKDQGKKARRKKVAGADEVDGGYNGTSEQETLEKIERLGARSPSPEERRMVGPVLTKAVRWSRQDGSDNIELYGPPDVAIVDSDEITFGAYYDEDSNTIFLERGILYHPAYDLVLVFIHEIHGKRHEENVQAEVRYLLGEQYQDQDVVAVYQIRDVRVIVLEGTERSQYELLIVSRDANAREAATQSHIDFLNEFMNFGRRTHLPDAEWISVVEDEEEMRLLQAGPMAWVYLYAQNIPMEAVQVIWGFHTAGFIHQGRAIKFYKANGDRLDAGRTEHFVSGYRLAQSTLAATRTWAETFAIRVGFHGELVRVDEWEDADGVDQEAAEKIFKRALVEAVRARDFETAKRLVWDLLKIRYRWFLLGVEDVDDEPSHMLGNYGLFAQGRMKGFDASHMMSTAFFTPVIRTMSTRIIFIRNTIDSLLTALLYLLHDQRDQRVDEFVAHFSALSPEAILERLDQRMEEGALEARFKAGYERIAPQIVRALQSTRIVSVGDPIVSDDDLTQYVNGGHYSVDSAVGARRAKLLEVLRLLNQYLPSFLGRAFPGVKIKSITVGGSMVEFWGSYPANSRMPYGEDVDAFVVTENLAVGDLNISLERFADGQFLIEGLESLGIGGVRTMVQEGQADLNFHMLYGSGITVWGNPMNIVNDWANPFMILGRVQRLISENTWQAQGRLVVAHWLLRGMMQRMGLSFEEYEGDINQNKAVAREVVRRNYRRAVIALAESPSNPSAEQDGGYNNSSVNHTKTKIARLGGGRAPKNDEAQLMIPAFETARIALGETHPNIIRGPPTVRMIDSKRITFGAYYDVNTHTLYLETPILQHPAYNLGLVFIHELNGQTHKKNVRAEVRYLLGDREAGRNIVGVYQARDLRLVVLGATRESQYQMLFISRNADIRREAAQSHLDFISRYENQGTIDELPLVSVVDIDEQDIGASSEDVRVRQAGPQAWVYLYANDIPLESVRVVQGNFMMGYALNGKVLKFYKGSDRHGKREREIFFVSGYRWAQEALVSTGTWAETTPVRVNFNGRKVKTNSWKKADGIEQEEAPETLGEAFAAVVSGNDIELGKRLIRNFLTLNRVWSHRGVRDGDGHAERLGGNYGVFENDQIRAFDGSHLTRRPVFD